MSQDTGLIQRGFFILALMCVLMVVVLSILFQRSVSTPPPSGERPEFMAALLVRSDTAFPAAVSWPGLYQIGEAFPSASGWQIRYNAAAALARRGSSQVPWSVLLEMLDENRQLHNFRDQRQDGQVIADEGA